MSGHYITTWRKPAPNVLDWDHHVSFNRADAETVVRNLKAQGIRQFHTYPLGEQIAELSQDWANKDQPQ